MQLPWGDPTVQLPPTSAATKLQFPLLLKSSFKKDLSKSRYKDVCIFIQSAYTKHEFYVLYIYSRFKNIISVFITDVTVAKGSHLILPHRVRFSKAFIALVL